MGKIFQDISSLKIQGATNIAIASLKHLKKFSRKKGFGKEFDQEAERLLKVRSTAVILYNVIQRLKKNKNKEKIDELLSELKEGKEKIAKDGASLIKNGFQVHTHCHSSKVVAIIREAAWQGKKFSVVVDITRPKLQGIITAKELAKLKNIKVILIADSAASLALSNPVLPMDDFLLVGADAIRKEGVVNKVGTYLLAVAAKEVKVPFYVASSTLKVDKRKRFKIEERKPSEVYRKIKNVTIRNPAFDLTPLKFVKGIITEKGLFSAKEFEKKFLK